MGYSLICNKCCGIKVFANRINCVVGVGVVVVGVDVEMDNVVLVVLLWLLWLFDDGRIDDWVIILLLLLRQLLVL